MIYYIGSERMINVLIDEFTPCLKDAETGELVETEVVRIRRKSMDNGYGGFMYGVAGNRELLNHYVEQLNAEMISILHPYHFTIDEENARHIMEVYDYVWTDEEI